MAILYKTDDRSQLCCLYRQLYIRSIPDRMCNSGCIPEAWSGQVFDQRTRSIVPAHPPCFGFWSLLLYLLMVLSPAGIAQGGGASKVFHGRGSLKAQGGISSWVPELDPKFLGDSNAGQPFLQVLSIGREAERAPPACKKILPRSLLVCCLFQLFSSTKKDRRLRKHH